MAFIDNTYFTDYINIGGINSNNSPVTGNTVNVTWIPKYEKEYLIAVLGYGFYTDFIAGLVTPTTKWTNLKNGVDYQVNGKTYRWNGFANSDKVSPIAYYVYCQYMTSVATISTGTGEKINTQQNSVNASPAMKIGYAWDAMRELNRSLWHFLDNNKDTYTEWDASMVEWCKLTGSRNAWGI